MFSKKNKEPEYITYEADDFYADEHIDYEPQKNKRKKKDKIDDNYYNESYEEYERSSRTKIFTKGIIVVAIYIIFIIIGVFSTSFMTNDIGKKEAQIVDVQLREERESYYALKSQYFAVKDLVSKADEIDKKLAASKSDNDFVYATEYQTILSNLDKQEYLPTAKSMIVNDKYITLKEQTVNIYQDLSYYLQKMSGALSNKDSELLKQALSWKGKTFDDFENLRSNMREFSKIIKSDDPEFENTEPIFNSKYTSQEGK